MSSIKITYTIEDGYVGPERPISFEMHTSEFAEDMTEDDVKEIVWDAIRNDMETRVSANWDGNGVSAILAELAKGEQP